MKRIVTLLLAAGLVFGAHVGAKAETTIKASGMWDFGFEWANYGFTKNNSGSDTFNTVQRFRTQIDIIASESLKGVVYFEIGKTSWGQYNGSRRGGGFGTDSSDIIKLRYSYVDWVVPNTDLKIRMGLQPYSLPGFVAGNAILSADGAGITASYQFNDMVGISLFWLRALSNNSGQTTSGFNKHDSLDLVGLTLPVKGDGFMVTPWGVVGSQGRNAFDNAGSYSGDLGDLRHGMLPVLTSSMGVAMANRDQLKTHATPWWLGLGAELTMFDPFRVAVEGAYGSVDNGSMSVALRPGSNVTSVDVKRSGWYTALIAEYKLDFMTPGLIFWYSSGDDSNPWNGSERLPILEGSWTATSFGYDGSRYGDANCAVGDNMIGSWGVVLRMKDISFMEDLSHVFRVGYYQGTNNKNMPRNAGMTDFRQFYMTTNGGAQSLYLTTKDHAWEVNFDTEYKIYKDLSFMFELGYINLKLDESTWGNAIHSGYDKNAYKVGAYMRYTF